MEVRPQLVIDGSVTLAWSLADENSAYAARVLDYLIDRQAAVPAVWLLEVANGLLMAERRGRSTQADTAEAIEALRGVPIMVEEPSFDRAFGEVLRLARERRLSAYDAAYLELAMREGLPLATLDVRLAEAAHAVGVVVFVR